ncbi:hypothetical protein DVJ78_08945 [Humibacter sp. BT305]|nr:hypothetical protein DVJ78_08945 [Humibacter sp. BT305]
MHENLRIARASRTRRILAATGGMALVGGALLGVVLPASAAVPGPGQIVPVSLEDAAGTAFLQQGRDPAVSADGRYVAFVSDDNPSNTDQIFLRDLQTGAMSIISHAADGTLGNKFSEQPEVSRDGRFVTYTSFATNLVASVDTHSVKQVYRYDVTSNSSTMVSVDDAATPSGALTGVTDRVAMSDDGNLIAFVSNSGLVTGDVVTASQVWVRDMQAQKTTLVSHTSTVTNGGDGASGGPAMSPNGAYIAWHSLATDLDGANAGAQQIYISSGAGTVTMVSRQPDGTTPGELASRDPDVADDGAVSFLSFAQKLVTPALTSGREQAYFNSADAITTLISHADGKPTVDVSGAAFEASISSDGQTVLFTSEATDVTTDGGNGVRQLYSWSRSTNASRLLSVTTAGTLPTRAPEQIELASDGVTAVFQSQADDLVASPDSDETTQAFAVSTLAPVPPTPTPDQSNGGSNGSTAGSGGAGAKLASTGADVSGAGLAGALGAVLLAGGAGTALLLRRRGERGASRG